MRLAPEQKRDLQILAEILEGNPPLNGLLQEAIRQYIGRKLEDPKIRAEYDQRTKPSLTVISSRRQHSEDVR